MAKKLRSDSKIGSSPHYLDIIKTYNEWFARDGKVNSRKFFDEIVKPKIEVTQTAWYLYVRRFKNEAGLAYSGAQALEVEKEVDSEEKQLQVNLLGNQDATNKGINVALNLGSAVLERIWKKHQADPESLTAGEMRIAAEYLFKAMKSIDSRTHAIGKVREDNREEEKMNKAFEDSQYGAEG